MTIEDHTEHTLSAGREGSAEACAILRRLFHAPKGLAFSAIMALTGLDERTTRAALVGLRYRNRAIVCGMGATSRWYVPQHAPKPTDAEPQP